MQISKLSEAIEHLEKAKELLFHRDMQETPFDDDVHGAVMSLGFYIKLLTNDLALAEREALANYKRANTVCTGQVAGASASPLLSTPEHSPVKAVGDKPAATCR